MSGKKFCIALLPNRSKKVCPIREILFADGDGKRTIPGTEERIKHAKKGATQTLRMRIKTQDGTQYSAITVLRFGEESGHLEEFLRNNETGRGKRLPNPKRQNFTPNLVRSISKIKKKKIIVRDEPVKSALILKKLQRAKEKAVSESDALVSCSAKSVAQLPSPQKKNEAVNGNAASETNVKKKKNRISKEAPEITPTKKKSFRKEKALGLKTTAIESDHLYSSSEDDRGQELTKKSNSAETDVPVHNKGDQNMRQADVRSPTGLEFQPHVVETGPFHKESSLDASDQDIMSLHSKLDIMEKNNAALEATLEAIRSSSKKELTECKAELLRSREECDALRKKLGQEGGTRNTITQEDLREALETSRKQLLLDLEKNSAGVSQIFEDFTQKFDDPVFPAQGPENGNGDKLGSSLPRPDADGKVSVAPGIRIDINEYMKAADAATMRMRANYIITAFWPQQETRLRLTLKEDHPPTEKLITSNEIKQIVYVCNQLQKHRLLKNTKNMDPCRKLRQWISAKLKVERHRVMKHKSTKEKNSQTSNINSTSTRPTTKKKIPKMSAEEKLKKRSQIKAADTVGSVEEDDEMRNSSSASVGSHDDEGSCNYSDNGEGSNNDGKAGFGDENSDKGSENSVYDYAVRLRQLKQNMKERQTAANKEKQKSYVLRNILENTDLSDDEDSHSKDGSYLGLP